MQEPDARKKILDAALRLFAHQGYGSTSVRELVEAAGVTKPTLYYYFDNKEALFRELIEARVQTFDGFVDEVVQSEGTVHELMHRFLSFYIMKSATDLDALRLMMTCSLPGAGGQPKVDVISRHMASLSKLYGLVERGQASGELRADLNPMHAVAALVGPANLHLAAILQGAPLAPDLIDQLLDVWLHGVNS